MGHVRGAQLKRIRYWNINQTLSKQQKDHRKSRQMAFSCSFTRIKLAFSGTVKKLCQVFQN